MITKSIKSFLIFFTSGISFFALADYDSQHQYSEWHAYKYYYYPKTKDVPIFQILCCIALPFVLAAIYLLYKYVRSKDKIFNHEGEIQNSNKFKNKYLLELYVGFCTSLIIREPKEYQSKLRPFRQALFHYGKFSKKEIYGDEEFETRLKHPINLHDALLYLNKHISRAEKIKLLNCICFISISNESLGEQEILFVSYYLKNAELSLNELDPAIKGVYEEYLFHQNKENKRNSESKITIPSSSSQREMHLKVLGLDKNASNDLVKVQYRKLVKMTHPDRFTNEPIEMIEHMKTRFQEIQFAYEQLMK